MHDDGYVDAGIDGDGAQGSGIVAGGGEVAACGVEDRRARGGGAWSAAGPGHRA